MSLQFPGSRGNQARPLVFQDYTGSATQTQLASVTSDGIHSQELTHLVKVDAAGYCHRFDEVNIAVSLRPPAMIATTAKQDAAAAGKSGFRGDHPLFQGRDSGNNLEG